ncbi:hypothetical protein C1645_819003 [Glomus cerebriforme]|uniref:Uncharacterized protein n=1 Tax=Glomus cerebriforme TaxID=658196 RepID=A0A397T6A2_9GLOM|nr:hypothetical protein C1645_819003 [Glomus cerebriforme]
MNNNDNHKTRKRKHSHHNNAKNTKKQNIIELSQSTKSIDDEWIKFGEFLGLKRTTKGDMHQYIINK